MLGWWLATSLTIGNGAGSTGLRKAIALAHWAEAHVHEVLGLRGEGGTTGQHPPKVAPKQSLHFPKQKPAKDRHCCYSKLTSESR